MRYNLPIQNISISIEELTMVDIKMVQWLFTALIVMTACALPGCASNPPKEPTSQEIKSDSDRAFEKMKQEERERNKDAGGTPR
jgi:hypothetical protein